MSTAEHGPITCKNCQTTFDGKFCPNCSQKADTHRLTVAHFGHEVFHAFTHTDRGVLLLMKELLYRPGKVAFEYNSGFRKKYFNPITFLLIITAIQIFASKKTDTFAKVGLATQQITRQLIDPDTEEGKKILEQSFKDTSKQVSVVEENNKAFTLLLIPMLAFFSWLLFKKSGHNYAENLVLHVLISGGTSLLFFVTFLAPLLLLPSLIVLWMGMSLIIGVVYNIVAYKQFFNQGWGITIFKGLVMQLVMVVFSQVLTTLLVKIV